MASKKSRRRRSNPEIKKSFLERKEVKIGILAITVIFLLAVSVYVIANINDDAIVDEETSNPIAIFSTTMGEFKIELFEDLVPITAGNFIDHANDGYYDGVIFHRVISNFMIQGGDPLGTGGGGHAANYHQGFGLQEDPQTWVIPDEFHEDLSNIRGTISMANRGPDTGGSQFFINVVDNTNLDFNKEPPTSKHAVFGRVIEGMEVVDNISRVNTTNEDRPLVDVVINSITIETQ